MKDEVDINTLTNEILQIKNLAQNIKGKSKGIQAIDRNVDRLLIAVGMLEINTCDVAKLQQTEE